VDVRGTNKHRIEITKRDNEELDAKLDKSIIYKYIVRVTSRVKSTYELWIYFILVPSIQI